MRTRRQGDADEEPGIWNYGIKTVVEDEDEKRIAFPPPITHRSLARAGTPTSPGEFCRHLLDLDQAAPGVPLWAVEANGHAHPAQVRRNLADSP